MYKFTDLTQNGTSYTFDALPSVSPVKRFKILTRPYNSATSNETPDAGENHLKIFSSLQDIFVNNLSDVSGDLMLYDISGILLQKMPFLANAVTTLPFNLPAGIYIAKCLTADEEVTERIILR